MINRLIKLKVSRVYLWTFISEFFLLISGVLVYKFAATTFGKDGFSEYAICRRIISFLSPIMLLGLGVGIPRFVAECRVLTNGNYEGDYAIAGLVLSVISSLGFLLVLNCFDKSFSFIFFGNQKYVDFIFPISLLIFGLVIHSICYSYLRGILNMYLANILQVVNLALVPIIVFVFNQTVIFTIFYTGLLTCIVSLIFTYISFRKIKWKLDQVFVCGIQLLKYGLQRIPGDLTLAALFAFPAFVTAHVYGIVNAGNIAFSISLVTMVGALFGPISLLLLPEAVKLISESNFKKLESNAKKILKYTILLTLAGLLIFELFADSFLNLYFGYEAVELYRITKILMFSCLGYTIYIVLRSILDAYHLKAVNTKNIFICFLLFLIFSAITAIFGFGITWLLIFFNITIWLLGYLSYKEYKNIFINERI